MQTYRADLDAANDNRHRKRWGVLWSILAVLALFAAILYFMGRSYLLEGLPALPNKDTMWEMNLKPNMTLLDDQGDILGHRGPHIGRPLKLSEMPDYLPNAFLAIEDERFYKHAGIDRKAILRALFENTKSGTTRQGGSTLTQQLVKNMLLTPDKTYRRKFQEMWLAYEMEQVLSKPEILELYLNRIDLGNRSFGVEAASQRYYGKSAAEITLSEAALLAALPKAPSRYDPSRNYEVAWPRAKVVLQRMVANGFISMTEMSEAETHPPEILEATQNAIASEKIGHLFDVVSERAQELVGSEHKDLVIHTTLNPKMQKAAHEELERVIKAHKKARKVSEGAVVMIDNGTGAVKVLVGGLDYQASKFNRAVQAKRQPGSSFKSFVYAAALEEGYTPATVRIDQPTEIAGWAPSNYTNRYRGPLTIREALKLSINTIAAQIGAEVGPKKVADIATRFGIKTPLRAHFSISLGASEATLLDMTSAYMVFANMGVRQDPYMIEAVYNTSGDRLYKRKALAPERVYAEQHAQQMVVMLLDVVRSGTGHGAKIDGIDIAGKTGTSQEFRDAWFMGFSKQYTTGVWMGNDDNSPMVKVTGGLLPADVWKQFMSRILRGQSNQPLLPEPSADGDKDADETALFYANLTEALIVERNLAAGIVVPDSGGGGDTSGIE